MQIVDIWPDGETSKRIYEEGGYRAVQVRRAGRAVIREWKRCLSPDKTRKNDMIKILFICHGNV